jgi:hypothetical protein
MRCLTFLVGTWRAAISYAAKCFSALKRKRPSMTDAELTALVAEVALTDPRSTPGVVAMLGLATKLAAEPEFADQPIRIVGGRQPISTEFVAQRMLHTARTPGKTAAEAVAWMRKIPLVTRGVGGAIKALYGVKCTERIALSDDVVLLPYLELPPSETRGWIFQEHDRANDARVLHGLTMAPWAALYRAGTAEPFFSPHGYDFTKAPQTRWLEDLDTAALLLALTPKAIPVEAAHWMHFDDPDLALLSSSGITSGVSEIPSRFRMSELALVTPDSAGGLLTEWRGVQSEDDRGRLRLALERLIRSRSQLNPGNRAIDLAIALEVLFMNVERDEHSYKISLRAARLLRTSLTDRRRVLLEVKRVYDLRSGMVHTGRAKDKWNIDNVQLSAYDLVESVDVLCMEAIRKFLH